jgi:hypothetical protein
MLARELPSFGGTMDESKVRTVRQNVKRQLRVGRVRLASLADEKKLLAQNGADREFLFSSFKSQGLEKELQLNEALLRLLMNYSKLASYRGVREGFEIYSYADELRDDRASYHLFKFLQKHPEATNQKLVEYLDSKNGRLAKLKAKPDEAHWAPLPAGWNMRLEKQKVSCFADSAWETALAKLPNSVMPYLSRVRKKARDAKVRNVLFNWPEIFKQHKRERK